MTAILWRVLIAAIMVVLIYALIPPFIDVLGVTVSVLRGGPPISA